MNANEIYKQAYTAHYSSKNYDIAINKYLECIRLFPDSKEKKYATTQIENIRKANIPVNISEENMELYQIIVKQEAEIKERQAIKLATEKQHIEEKEKEKEMLRIAAEEEARKKREEELHINQEYVRKQGLNGYYEYKVLSLLDNRGWLNSNSGRIDTQAMTKTLNDLGLEGWRLVTAYSNEAGKNAFSGGSNGTIFGTNSTIDENILIFERFVTV